MLSCASIPFGDVSHFFYFCPLECTVVTQIPECSFSVLAVEHSLHTQVNFVLNTKPYYADPLESVFEKLAVERNLDVFP